VRASVPLRLGCVTNGCRQRPGAAGAGRPAGL
jgi:hypothetical protein